MRASPPPIATRLFRLPALVLLVALALAALFFPRFALAAEPLAPKDVPDPLKPWTAWALDGSEDALCPTFNDHGDVSRCAWPSRLELTLDEHGGRFTQSWHLDAKRWVPLPGDAKRWPSDVKVGAARAVIVPSSGAPSVLLEKGDQVVSGTFAWDSLPESLHVPPETGLLTLTLRGARIAAPNRDAQGTVWLQKAATNEEGDALELVVHRRLTDDIPFVLLTRIEFRVSGKSREELLGKALPAGFIPMALRGDLPARLEPDGRVRVQVRPGVFAIDLTARSEEVVSALTRPTPDGLWREGDEVWVFEAKNDYRVVTVGGAQAIDPQQTTIPESWKRLPAYAMKVGDTLKFVETRRGDADPPPNQLTLARTLWLDFEGKGLTASDTITGTLTRDSRLTMAAPTVLGRVAIGGKDQFITRLSDPKLIGLIGLTGLTGVEVREGSLQVKADSRIPGDPSDVPAVSWAHDFHQVTGTLHLPPGWRLLHASGVDDVPGTWVRHWSLLELFLALVITMGVGKLYGARWGGVALVTLALTFPEEGAPKWFWLAVLGAEALVRVLPGGRVKTFFSGARTAAAVLVAMVAVPFLVQHVREGLYPALERPGVVVSESGSMSPDQAATERDEEEVKDNAQQLLAKSAPASVAPRAAGGQSANAPPPPVAAPSEAVDLLSQQLSPKTPLALSVSRGRPGQSPQNANVYDPAAVVQTGPGLPRWGWKTLALRWSGPVTATQRLHLYLSSPGVNLVLALVRASLLILLLARMLPWTQRLLPRGWGGAATGVLAAVLVCTVLTPRTARAEVPSKELLDELQARLLRKPACLPSCASSGRMALDARGGFLRVRLEVDAAAATAVPLPGSTGQFSPSQVLLDGATAKGLARLSDGSLWIALSPGPHQIALEGPLPDGASMQLALPMKPHRVEATTAPGEWTIAGIHEDGLADDVLQLTRMEPPRGDAGGGLEPGELPPFVRVERSLQVGLNWQVETHVFRVTPVGSAIVLEIPLLAGESVTTADVRVAFGKAQVNLGPQVSEVAWHSELEQRSPLKLTAPKSLPWVEVWRADVGPVWHATYAGIPFVHTQPEAGARIGEWRPWPGEEATVALVRPDGVKGQTLTIDQSTTDVTPGLRATDVTLSLSIRSSRGAQHTITLPPDAQLESLTIDGATQPIRQDGRKVTVPVVPGAQKVVLVWRETPGIDVLFAAPAVDLGAPSVNATILFHVPGGRWLLFAAGPRVGPAVLFWSLLLVLLVVAIALGRNRWTPLRTQHWLLLAIGLSQVDVVAGAIVVGWLLALGWRSWHLGEHLSAVAFDARQVLLVVWTAVALVLLFTSLERGLLGAPAMQVGGNGSTADALRWFVDRCDGPLPVPWMLSVPILVYRAAMLAWALWLARALLGWLRWGWGAFTVGGSWKKRPPPPPVVTQPFYPPPPVTPAPPPTRGS